MGSPSVGEIPSAPSVDKPDAAATKAYKSAVKSLNKAHEYEEAMAKATNPDKKADAIGQDRRRLRQGAGLIHRGD